MLRIEVTFNPVRKSNIPILAGFVVCSLETTLTVAELVVEILFFGAIVPLWISMNEPYPYF